MSIIPVVGLEALSQDTELEYVWYAKVDDVPALVAHLSEHTTDIILQEQYQKRYNGLSQRVRKERDKSCTFTVKTWQEGVQGRQETNHDIDVDTFDAIATEIDQGWLKLRFLLPVPEQDGLTYEVDVYFDPTTDDNYSPWVKVDVEVDEPLPTPLDIPFTATQIVQRSAARDAAVDKQINDICEGWVLTRTQIKQLLDSVQAQ